jgi:hypothetical protein
MRMMAIGWPGATATMGRGGKSGSSSQLNSARASAGLLLKL